jgi:hypothetical protein
MLRKEIIAVCIDDNKKCSQNDERCISGTFIILVVCIYDVRSAKKNPQLYSWKAQGYKLCHYVII